MSTKMKVLYVDDEDINVALFKMIFNGKYEIFCCNNGNEGLQILCEVNDIQVVISDMKMPYMNGIEFISKAREIKPGLKCYLLTGFGITNEIQNAIEKGHVLHCFIKPMNKLEIEETIGDNNDNNTE